MMAEEIGRGAEAVITRDGDRVTKWRRPKGYRVAALDERIRRDRTVMESRLISEARRCGVPTPIIFDVDNFSLTMEHIDGVKLKDVIDLELSERAGGLAGRLHSCGIVHGDLTTSNMILRGEKIYFIDFGLAFYDNGLEAQGVDVHVFFQTVRSTHDRPEELVSAFCRGYARAYPRAGEVLKRVEEIEARGRYL
ncbi:Kae1-associated kinase Bud32 [Methanotrichaceae archaeon M04Ac]|uniref:non-specific serine/threonine protein kinase n=2 Tax=Candidatus Methanocrinis alkalitolerans TaxID=3033395 RepID=A0ABT5XER3_9EURY|nr:Kae1-associated kinase Bud32 [Candidatus Methanocrinis alkalitolerans]MCR3882862.1 Kae1-associated kinase Bud32 [Methanothrix sp.]MDF0593198.1 Kae1-associated kinase Bud32 [Candidatus Methanocrinis alkalitolerans]